MTKPTDTRQDCPPTFDLRETFLNQGPRLMRLLRKWSSPADAEDVVQESFLHLVSLEPERLSLIRSPHAYLRQTAANLIQDRAKTSRRRAGDRHVAIEDTILSGPDPMCGLEARDMLHRLEATVARMPARRREIFLAHRLDGYTYAEIAARTGLSVKGVEKQMSRAIAQIDRLMVRR